MTTDFSGCAKSELPDFPWVYFESILRITEDQAGLLYRKTSTSRATRTSSPPIKYCGKLQPQVDTPFSSPAHECGPTYFNDQLPQMHHPLPLSSSIQG